MASPVDSTARRAIERAGTWEPFIQHLLYFFKELGRCSRLKQDRKSWRGLNWLEVRDGASGPGPGGCPDDPAPSASAEPGSRSGAGLPRACPSGPRSRCRARCRPGPCQDLRPAELRSGCATHPPEGAEPPRLCRFRPAGSPNRSRRVPVPEGASLRSARAGPWLAGSPPRRCRNCRSCCKSSATRSRPSAAEGLVAPSAARINSRLWRANERAPAKSVRRRRTWARFVSVRARSERCSPGKDR